MKKREVENICWTIQMIFTQVIIQSCTSRPEITTKEYFLCTSEMGIFSSKHACFFFGVSRITTKFVDKSYDNNMLLVSMAGKTR